MDKEEKVLFIALRLLICIDKRSSQTEKEIKEEYNRKYPPAHVPIKLVQKVISEFQGLSASEFKKSLEYLILHEYVKRDITRFTDVALKGDVAIYSITGKGIHALSRRKAK
jgi:hypothetical protein